MVHDIQKIVEDYISSRDTDYAILINGQWGSGKTHFIKNDLMSELSSRYKCLYVSLNGVANTTQIEKDLLFEFVGVNQKNKYIKYISEKIGHISSFLTKFFLRDNIKIDITSISLISLFNLTDVIIFIDDLERISSKLELGEVLGYINRYLIEDKRAKVILIGNLTKIKQSKRIKKIKEKLIGRQILFEYGYEEIFNLVIKKYFSVSDFKIFLKDNKDLIVDYLKEFAVTNLRTIFFFINHLSKFYKAKGEIDKKTWRKIILFAMVISIEFKKGRFIKNEKQKKETLLRLTNNIIVVDILSRRQSNDQNSKETFSEHIVKNYLREHRREYKYSDSIYNAIVIGYFNEDAFREEFRKGELQRYNETLLSLQDYLSWSEAQFKEKINLIMEGLEKGIFNIYTHQMVFTKLFDFSIKHLIDENVSEIKSKIYSSLEIARQRETDYDRDIFNMGNFPVNNDDDSKEIYEKIKQIHDKYYSNWRKHQVLGILKELELDRADFSVFFRSLLLIPLSNFLSVEQIISKIKEATNYSINEFVNFIEEKYKYDDYQTIDDLDLISGLSEEIEKILITNAKERIKAENLKNLLRILQVAKQNIERKSSNNKN